MWETLAEPNRLNDCKIGDIFELNYALKDKDTLQILQLTRRGSVKEILHQIKSNLQGRNGKNID
jgi:hypothetical protein